MNLVATTFASQPVCNATRAAHALHSTNNDKNTGARQGGSSLPVSANNIVNVVVHFFFLN
jgi:hypothetical protein